MTVTVSNIPGFIRPPPLETLKTKYPPKLRMKQPNFFAVLAFHALLRGTKKRQARLEAERNG